MFVQQVLQELRSNYHSSIQKDENNEEQLQKYDEKANTHSAGKTDPFLITETAEIALQCERWIT